jgi:glutamyl-tRNA reductase
MRLLVLGLNHKTAPVATREAFAIPSEMVPGLNRRIVNEPTVAEVMVLSTCNRVEVYAVPEGDDASARETLIRALATERGLDPDELLRHGYVHAGVDAARHLVRVCASLDSLVVGEAQILAQVKEAFQSARDACSTGPVLEQAVQAAFRGGKAVRTDTGIAEETVSIGSVAVELARRIFPTLSKCRVLVIGAGKMGRVTARALARAGVAEVVVTNRSPARAERLAAELGWTARPFAELDDLLVAADVVLTCTGAERPILDPRRIKTVVKRRKYRPLFLVDIAVPRDVDPAVAELEQVYLYNIDDLEAVSREHLAHRQGEAQKAEVIVEDAVARMVERATVQAVVPVLKAVRDRAESTLRGELERAFAKRLAHLSQSDREAVLAATQAGMNKLLHPVLTALREQGHERYDVATAARLLFGLDPATSPPPELLPEELS